MDFSIFMTLAGFHRVDGIFPGFEEEISSFYTFTQRKSLCPSLEGVWGNL